MHAAWFTELVAQTGQAFGALAADGTVLWLNPAGERVFGPERIGQALGVPRSSMPQLVPAPADPERVLELTFIALQGAPGGATALFLAADVTARERGRRAEAQVMAALERIGEGASVLAHDIKNPIAALHLALRAVARHLGEDERAVIEDLAVRLERLERTVRRTVGFARPIELRPRAIELSALIERVIGELGAEVAAAGAVLERRIEPGLEVRADADRLADAFVAVVRNALESGAQHVRIAARTEPEGILVEVADDGPGLQPSARANLFRPFHTTKVEGSGLGLALARRCLEAHGGRIEAAASDLGGAGFHIHVPWGSEP